MLAGKVLVVFVLAASALASVDATHCTTYSTSTTDMDEGIIIVEQHLVPIYSYTFVHVCQGSDCRFALGFYEESNGIAGLQRGDFLVSDTCHGMIAPDTYLF